MNTKYFLITAFIILALAQLFVPAKMIYNHEETISTGKEFHFRTQAIDPNDPFRGKFIRLRYTNEFFVNTDTTIEWHTGETAYVILGVDSLGFAKILSGQKTVPSKNVDYLKVKLGYVNDYKVISSNQKKENQIDIDFPFDRYYMEESKSQDAEDIYETSTIDTNSICYSVVHIKNGEAVLTDIIINDKSIKDIVKENQNNLYKD